MLKKLVLPAAGIAIAIGLAAPAHADPTDDQFISSLNSQGIPYASPNDAVQEAKNNCTMLRSGHSFADQSTLLGGASRIQ